MSTLYLPERSAGAGLGGATGGEDDGEDPNRRGGYDGGGHGGDDAYLPPIDGEGESGGSSGYEEDLEQNPKKLQVVDQKKKPKVPYDSERRRSHYETHNVVAQKNLKAAMVNSLNRFLPKGGNKQYELQDAEKTRFFTADRPPLDRCGDHDHYWKRNPGTQFDQVEQSAWERTFHKGNTASRWGSQNMKRLTDMVDQNKIIPSRSFKDKEGQYMPPCQPQPRPQPLLDPQQQQELNEYQMYADGCPIMEDQRQQWANNSEAMFFGNGPVEGFFPPRQRPQGQQHHLQHPQGQQRHAQQHHAQVSQGQHHQGQQQQYGQQPQRQQGQQGQHQYPRQQPQGQHRSGSNQSQRAGERF
ncbi:uncharacterized protein DFL_005142 [Arthrobotrys flagrans]|uniref:Uncharacterized protein n=1 Tax=Arthrobotrys flagrans TaxID=97331 RepID=A0A437A6U0_ARTFL|nr:hypothetical protein DFL_005142 [Arthrobotrys flagrans]